MDQQMCDQSPHTAEPAASARTIIPTMQQTTTIHVPMHVCTLCAPYTHTFTAQYSAYPILPCKHAHRTPCAHPTHSGNIMHWIVLCSLLPQPFHQPPCERKALPVHGTRPQFLKVWSRSDTGCIKPCKMAEAQAPLTNTQL